MDAQTIRRAVWDLFKFNQKDFNVQGNLTGYGVSLRRQPSASAAEVRCQLQPSIVTVDDVKYVEIRWGIVANQQPTGFSAGGLPPYQVEAEDGQFFYAAATVDPDTLLWNSSYIEVSFDPGLAPTSTIAYRLLFSVAEVDTDVFEISSYICGPITFDVCELAI